MENTKKTDGKLIPHRIKWQYVHCLGRNSTIRVKTGHFIRLVKHRKPYQKKAKAIVKFDGNKNNSVVPVNELRADD